MNSTAKPKSVSDDDGLRPDGEVAEETQELLEDLDRESRTRPYQDTWLKIPVLVAGVVLSLYHMYIALFSGPPQLVHRAIHVSAILVLCFALYRPTRKQGKPTVPWYDWVFVAISASIAMYIAPKYSEIVSAGGRFDTIDVVFGALLVFVVLEAARRLTGWALPVLAVLFIVYGIYGRYMPGAFKHRGYDLDRILNFMLSTNEGVFSTAIGVSSTYIFLFILFGAVLAKSGMGEFFNNLAMAIAGQTRGGPAKVSVIASGFLGSINGSAIANVVTTGAFTIPLMKRIGYRPNFAGAVEASASVGGQLLPPIMGAAAFIMAETLGVPYQQIALVAIVPALLYYLGVIVQVHLRATRDGLKGISKDNIPAVLSVLKERGHLLIPLAYLLFMLFFSGRTILFSAVTTVIVTIIVAQLRKSTRMSIMDILESLRDGAITAVSVAVACACVGIIVGIATLTGLGVKLAGAIVAIGGGLLLPTLIMTALACIILGMGLPSIPAYIITATMAAPALGQIGVEPLVAHLFVFYFGLFANITPPVALAAFAGAGLAGGDPMKTGFAAMKLAVAGYIVPFVFVYNPGLLWQEVAIPEALWITVTATIGVLVLAVAAEGMFMVRVPIIVRLIMASGAILLIVPGSMTDIVAFGILGVGFAIQLVLARKQQKLSIRNI
ncbi:TRAP transporter permease [Brevibacterium sp. HMSC24B04]|uniref:TRAP transporter permease n=1 Tax=Brevibacterium sp. HMSC24B04 TaxID=1581060 RepID=UPI0008A1E59A|nr:TRAP transporter permease [Brevibacterium sp. HMSC24B04]OFT93419.1 C4-dicarboxylate ABC transporter permease [Brevibacterium sp. HMSC24B04]